MGGTPDQVVYDQIKAYAPDTFVVFTPYDSSGQPMFGGAVENNVFNGLTMRTFSSAGAVNSYLQSVAESSEGKLENILGVYSVPGDFLSELSEAVETIPPWQSGGAIGPDLCRNAKCYSSEFCVAQVEGMNCETVTYKPELITTEGTFNFHIYGRFIGGGGGIIATPDAYDYMGNPGEYGCAITVFPQGAWVGNQYAQYQQTNKVNILATTAKSAGSFILAGAAAATGVGMAAVPGLVASGLSSAASIWDADTKAKKGSAAVNGSVSSDPILAAAIGQFGFKFRWYMCNESIMKSVDSFFDRYGYKVMRLKVPERNSRPCWNFVKTSEGHVSGAIPTVYRERIEAMLNAGVTFWNVGARAIGDFSNPSANKS